MYIYSIYLSYIIIYIHTLHTYIYVCKHKGFSPIWVKFGCQSSFFESSSAIWWLKSGLNMGAECVGQISAGAFLSFQSAVEPVFFVLPGTRAH